jgi:hypothetical protein
MGHVFIQTPPENRMDAHESNFYQSLVTFPGRGKAGDERHLVSSICLPPVCEIRQGDRGLLVPDAAAIT